MHYFKGKKILYDIVAFAKESVNSHVITLGPQNFPGKEKEPWLVDFFAPVSTSVPFKNKQMGFGTADSCM